jgi:hypothetical protein
MLDLELWGLMFALLSFGLALIPSFLVLSLFLPFGMGMFILYHSVLRACNFIFFDRGSQIKRLP